MGWEIVMILVKVGFEQSLGEFGLRNPGFGGQRSVLAVTGRRGEENNRQRGTPFGVDQEKGEGDMCSERGLLEILRRRKKDQTLVTTFTDAGGRE